MPEDRKWIVFWEFPQEDPETSKYETYGDIPVVYDTKAQALRAARRRVRQRWEAMYPGGKAIMRDTEGNLHVTNEMFHTLAYSRDSACYFIVLDDHPFTVEFRCGLNSVRPDFTFNTGD